MKKITESEFKEKLIAWRVYQYMTDPFLAQAVDFLGISSKDISKEAVLTSILRSKEAELVSA